MADKSATVLACTCKHQYQDETYGVNKRLHNPMANGQWRCTVCSKVNGSVGQSETKKK